MRKLEQDVATSRGSHSSDPAATGVLGPHTSNTGAGLAVVDLFAPRTTWTRA